MLAYDDMAAILIRRLKYGNHRDALGPLAGALAQLVDEGVDHLTWVPASIPHRRRRGFDQGELLATAMGRRLGVRPRRLLRRIDGRAQTDRHRRDRLAGPELAAVGGLSATVLLVDDVRTTGSSLAAGARALRHAGAGRIVAATLAATPDRFGATGSTIDATSESPSMGERGPECRFE